MREKNLKTTEASILIEATPEAVWDAWSRFENVADYVATIPKSYLVGDAPLGEGCTRRCDISKRMQVEETITAWKEHEHFAMKVTKTKGVPIETMLVDFHISDAGDGKTRASVRMRYRMKGLVRFLPVGGAMQQQALDHVVGLKHHIETGELVDEEKIKELRARYEPALMAA